MGSPAMGAAVLVVVGCSSARPALEPEKMPVPSEDVEIMTTRPRRAPVPVEPEVVLEIDPGPGDEPDALFQPVLPECLPAGAGAAISLEPDALRACWNRGGNFAAPADACLWIGKDGSLRAGAPPAPVAAVVYPRTTVSADGTRAEVCLAADRCQVLAPRLAGDQQVVQAELDDNHARVAVLVESPTSGDGSVFIYSAADGRLEARGDRSARHDDGARHVIDYVGSAVLWVTYPAGSESAIGELWKTKRTKLKLRKTLRGRIGQWGSLGDGRFVFSDDGPGAQIWDVKKARRTASLVVEGLVDREELAAWRDSGDASMLATREDAFALMAVTRTGVRVAFVDAAERRPRPLMVPVPQCE